MTRKSKADDTKHRARELSGSVDMSAHSTAIAFRVAAKAFTEKAMRTKATATATLHREGILTKSGAFTKTYGKKG